MIKCGNCGQKVTSCDSCDDNFSRGDAITCSTRDHEDKHFCVNCMDVEAEVI